MSDKKRMARQPKRPTEIKVKQRIQAGDIWLIQFVCPICQEEHTGGWPVTDCTRCGNDLSSSPVSFSGEAPARILAGTKRKAMQPGKLRKRFMEMLQEQCGLCAYCGVDLEYNFHLDHIIPLCVGGSNLRENLCLACAKCNMAAGKRYFSSVEEKIKYIREWRRKYEDK